MSGAFRVLAIFLGVAASLMWTTAGGAHPHVLPSVKLNLIFNADGLVTAIEQTWLYDAMYSTFVGRDIDADKDGTISKGELASFAKTQIDALAPSSFFTTMKTPAGEVELGQAKSYALEKQNDGRLRLSFTLPLKQAISVDHRLVVELFDPAFFAYFTIADDGVSLVNAPQGCAETVAGPQPIDLRNTRSVPALFWQALDGSKDAGRHFINRVTLACP